VIDGPAFEDVPLERLTGPGVVWRVENPPLGLVEPSDLEAMRPALEPGDIVALDTGAQARMGTEAYDQHPSLSVEAARWLLERQVKLIAVDVPTPELALSVRPDGFAGPFTGSCSARSTSSAATARRPGCLHARWPCRGSAAQSSVSRRRLVRRAGARP
jgi:kynurenine formamidase